MPDFEIEEQSFGMVVGVDEVGRGAWAGPVVAAAVIIDRSSIEISTLRLIKDSKQISELNRFKIEQILTDTASVISAVGSASVAEIDNSNILDASLLAMQRAYNNLPVSADTALVDGLQAPDIRCPVKTVVKGDTKSISIAAASIFAKVHRDNIMIELAKNLPSYQWEKNKGYGTANHKIGLKTNGVTIHHRKTFSPIALLLQNK